MMVRVVIKPLFGVALLGMWFGLVVSWIDTKCAEFVVEVIDGVLGEGSLEIGKGLAQLQQHRTQTAYFPRRVQIEGVPAVH